MKLGDNKNASGLTHINEIGIDSVGPSIPGMCDRQTQELWDRSQGLVQ